MTELKVGDKAIVRLDLEVTSDKYQCYIDPNMYDYNGKIVTITDAKDCDPDIDKKYPANKCFRIAEDNENYIWTDAMLFPTLIEKSKVVTKTIKPIT